MLVDLELWLSLEVGNATGAVDRITRSMTQFLELQQELAKEFAGYSPSALEEAMSSASLTKKSADSKMELLQVILATAPGVSNEGGEFSPLGPGAGRFLALGSGLGLVGTASSRR